MLVAIVHVAACSSWYVFLLCTAKYPLIGDPDPGHLIEDVPFALLSAADAVLALWVLAGGIRSWRDTPDLRLGHLAGALLALLALGAVQLGAVFAHRAVAIAG